ncbi:MAG: bifunctional 5,10-methylenetetrahydrofolate dehydrogenase/5,10-methenyltetrahydrofolate cyclohydrolase [Gluconobacter japonicus]|uniref:bifunctional 5,10-methylenetetrahydrofolate dehydrogenase/5,10-methenyltetrahydrofolate cyclohydrolase n=1 Tax=Gluconobacter japonicus TaxID=376620 RepID=UPI0039E86947
MTTILHTSDLAEHYLGMLKAQISIHPGTKPTLAVITGSSEAGPQAYIRRIAALGEHGGITIKTVDVTGQDESAFCKTVRELGVNPRIDGILVLFPLPDGISRDAVLAVISADKDVDCLHPLNLGKVTAGTLGFQPCTATGALMAAEYLAGDLRGKNCVIIGSSAVVGRPLAMCLLDRGATVSVVHIDTWDIQFHCRHADILFSAVGKARLVNKAWIKPRAILIDIGISYCPAEGRVVGDVDLESVDHIASAVTAVPDGVGPLTTCTLLANTAKSAFDRMGVSFTFPNLPVRDKR